MKVLNKASALIALITIDYAVCNESGLHHLRPSAANDIETSSQGSSTADIGRDLQGLNVMRSTVLEYWNVKRGESGIQDLRISHVGNSEAQRMVQQMADAEQVTTTFDPVYDSTCHGTSFIMVGSYDSLDPVLDSWYNSDNGKNTANYHEVRYTGIGFSTRGSVMYMLQLFCSYNFVNNIELTNTGNGIRTRIRRYVTNERQTDLDPINDLPAFQTLAQIWADEAASRGRITIHDGNGSDNYRRKCYGAGGEVGASGTKLDIESTIESAISGYLTDGSIRYMGIGIAARNDGAVFLVQVFCSLDYMKALADKKKTASEKMVTAIVQKEIERRKRVNKNSRETELKISPVTSEYAQEWADKLANSNTISEDPNSGRGCGNFSFQVVAIGSRKAQIWKNIFNQVKKRKAIESVKIKFVGTGISKIDGTKKYVVVQNFCTWKPTPKNV